MSCALGPIRMKQVHEIVVDRLLGGFGASLHDSGGLSLDHKVRESLNICSLEVAIQVLRQLHAHVEHSDPSFTVLSGIEHCELNESESILF